MSDLQRLIKTARKYEKDGYKFEGSDMEEADTNDGGKRVIITFTLKLGGQLP